MAQALLVFTATDLFGGSLLHKHLFDLSHRERKAQRRLGTLGMVSVLFPREQIEGYCSCHLTAERVIGGGLLTPPDALFEAEDSASDSVGRFLEKAGHALYPTDAELTAPFDRARLDPVTKGHWVHWLRDKLRMVDGVLVPDFREKVDRAREELLDEATKTCRSMVRRMVDAHWAGLEEAEAFLATARKRLASEVTENLVSFREPEMDPDVAFSWA